VTPSVSAIGMPSRAPSRRPAAAVVPGARRVVVLGGGTGAGVLLQGLRRALFPARGRAPRAEERDRLTAIVTVADDGGSSGRLRAELGGVAPGDIRKCLLAVADADPTLAALFGFRFDGQGGLAGHSLGNLILAALARIEGELPRALDRVAELLGTRGRILPATPDDVRLVAEYADGTSMEGESRIPTAGRPIRRIRLCPEGARALPEALEALALADVIVIGPGSLYTSLIPVLLVREVAAATARSKARVVLVMNLLTQPGETDGYTALDHLLALRRHAPQVPIHHVLVNVTPIPRARRDGSAGPSARPVAVSASSLRALGCRPHERHLLADDHVRHDPHRLARAVLELS